MTCQSTEYDIGDLVRVRGEFETLATGAAVDPSAVNLSVKSPNGKIVTYAYGTDSITREAQGEYYYDIDANSAGYWYYRWWSTGTGQASGEGRFLVKDANARK